MVHANGPFVLKVYRAAQENNVENVGSITLTLMSRKDNGLKKKMNQSSVVIFNTLLPGLK